MLKRKDLSKGPERSVGVYRFLLLVSGIWGFGVALIGRRAPSFFSSFPWCSRLTLFALIEIIDFLSSFNKLE